MTQPPQPPELLENRVTNLERGMTNLQTAAEALLQTAQIHQRNFEAVTAELRSFHQRQRESDERFEVMLSELRQIKIDSDARFDTQQTEISGLRTEIRRILDRFFNIPDA
jgi:chromosome segregation ATPase